jgi:alcohol dehydrogenase
VSTPVSDPIRRNVTYGDDAILALPQLVEDLGARRVLLVTGQRSFEASGAARMVPTLQAAAVVTRWSDFAPNTDAADLAKGLEVVAEFAPDLIVAVGGGSAMDMAKLLCAYRGVAGPEGVVEAIQSGAAVRRGHTQLILVPTTSGSGSEATHFAVVYVGDEKYSIADRTLLPDHVILDPSLTLSGSPYQRATSGIDAVAQAIESLWASGATERSRGFARHALRHLLANLETFVNEPSSSAARGMAIGSHLAGRAIDISKTTAAHALSYGLTKGYGISHGHAVALTLGPFIEAHAVADASRLQSRVDPVRHAETMTTVLTRLGASTPAEARERFDALLRRIGLDPSLEAAGVDTEERRAALAASVNLERLGNNPVVFDGRGLERLLADGR